MGFSTWLGPIRTGTVKDTTGTTAGTVANCGVVTLSQTTQIGYAAGTTTVGWIPAGSQIVNVFVDVTTAYTTSSGNVALTIGNGSTANQFWTTTNLGTAGRLATSNAALGNWYNIGSTDVPVVITLTGGNGTAGAANVTVQYVQKNSDGSAAPSQS
jgi:hypothetical protein